MTHKASIISVEPDTVTVRVIDGEACDACKLAGCCGSGKSPAAELRISTNRAFRYKTGDIVEVETAPNALGKAILWGFILPVIILVGAIMAFAGASDATLGAAVGLICVAIYFLILRMLRHRLSDSVQWRLREP